MEQLRPAREPEAAGQERLHPDRLQPGREGLLQPALPHHSPGTWSHGIRHCLMKGKLRNAYAR